ncbi:tetraspanin-4 isoform X6 [Vidua macroura]|uniref:tetraspanin-4 isoform X6 n=1 Tax=Vidua macroura TaxID=187451 RepID=UPI0023A8B637|nr:tetraspanin-4 isoform X6 [Vidua macroura]
MTKRSRYAAYKLGRRRGVGMLLRRVSELWEFVTERSRFTDLLLKALDQGFGTAGTSHKEYKLLHYTCNWDFPLPLKVASLKEPAVTAVGGQELLPIASSVSSAKPPVTVPSVLVAEATLSTGITSSALSSSSSIRTEEVQHGSQLPAVYQVPNVCFQPSLLVGRLWNPWCRHLAGCYPRELCHPLLFFPIPVCCQPTDRHRDVCHDHWLRGLHRCHQRKQVLPAEFFYHAVNYISVGAHCCDSVLRLHRQDRQVCSAGSEERTSLVWDRWKYWPH